MRSQAARSRSPALTRSRPRRSRSRALLLVPGRTPLAVAFPALRRRSQASMSFMSACRPSVFLSTCTPALSPFHVGAGPWLSGSILWPSVFSSLLASQPLAAGAVLPWTPRRPPLFFRSQSLRLLGPTFYSPSPQKSMSPCSDHVCANDLCAELFEDVGCRTASW